MRSERDAQRIAARKQRIKELEEKAGRVGLTYEEKLVLSKLDQLQKNQERNHALRMSNPDYFRKKAMDYYNANKSNPSFMENLNKKSRAAYKARSRDRGYVAKKLNKKQNEHLSRMNGILSHLHLESVGKAGVTKFLNYKPSSSVFSDNVIAELMRGGLLDFESGGITNNGIWLKRVYRSEAEGYLTALVALKRWLGE